MEAVKKTASTKTLHHPSSVTHRTLQKSSTLNRKFVKKPVVANRIKTRAEQEAETLARRKAMAEKINQRRQQLLSHKKPQIQPILKQAPKSSPIAKEAPATTHPAAALANARLQAIKSQEQPRHLSSEELKDRAIKQALRRVATMSDQETSENAKSIKHAISKQKNSGKRNKFLVAFSMSFAAVALLGYLVHLNLPDLSVHVAAMQSGIDSAYPSYIPSGYRLEGLVSEKDGKITMTFVGNASKTFTITEQKSPWDSSALLSQFVNQEWGEDYQTAKEQGLTIYTHESEAVWVNGGVFYHIEADTGSLNKNQLHSIAISL